MPRKKLIRRFEPRFGVSQSMLDIECRYVARELEDRLLLSLSDLREKFAEIQQLVATTEEELQNGFSRLPDRERIALRSMLARDFWHIAMLYRVFFTTTSMSEATGAVRPAPPEVTDNSEPVPVIPFRTTLFD